MNASDTTHVLGNDGDAARAAQAQWIFGHKYRIIQKLDDGGMGAVYLAVQIGAVSREVVVKVIKADYLSTELVARFLREVETLARLQHPNLVSILDSGYEESDRPDGLCGPFYVMPRIKGKNLRELIWRAKRSGPIPVATVVRLSAAIARPLRHLHTHGVVHRDIKPSNVMVTDDGEPPAVLIDTGVVRSIADDAGLTATGAPVGTERYASPQQYASWFVAVRDPDRRPTPADDWFSFGLMWREAVLGHHPFDGGKREPGKAIDLPPTAALRPDLPPELAALLDRLTAHDPAARPDGDEVVATLRRLDRELNPD